MSLTTRTLLLIQPIVYYYLQEVTFYLTVPGPSTVDHLHFAVRKTQGPLVVRRRNRSV